MNVNRRSLIRPGRKVRAFLWPGGAIAIAMFELVELVELVELAELELELMSWN